MATDGDGDDDDDDDDFPQGSMNLSDSVRYIITPFNVTLILNYDSNKLSHQSIEHVLKKWDCNSGEFSFRNIVSMK